MAKHTRLGPAEEQEWLDEQEKNTLRYFESASIIVESDLEIEWCVAPIVALWRANRMGLRPIWVISGDLPTDYLDDPSLGQARTVMVQPELENRSVRVSD